MQKRSTGFQIRLCSQLYFPIEKEVNRNFQTAKSGVALDDTYFKWVHFFETNMIRFHQTNMIVQKSNLMLQCLIQEMRQIN